MTSSSNKRSQLRSKLPEVRLLADEGVHRYVVSALREAGFDVEWIKETAAGSADQDILSRPDIAEFVLITNDSDFGELIFHHGYPVPYAVIFSRLPHRGYQQTANAILHAIANGVLSGQFTTIDARNVRTKQMPKEPQRG